LYYLKFSNLSNKNSFYTTIYLNFGTYMIDLFGHIYEESECNCEKCNSMCSNNKPCWGLPEEIEAIMNSGYIHRLMLVYYLDNDYRPIQILSPALIGYESKVAPVIQIGRCTFFNAKNACTLHKFKLKTFRR
jgi:hypothetical protein